MVQVKIRVSANDSVSAWWVTVDQTDLVFDDEEEDVELSGGEEHLLYYWIQGSAGGALEITVEQGSDLLRRISDAIPLGYSKVGNARFFKTN